MKVKKAVSGGGPLRHGAHRLIIMAYGANLPSKQHHAAQLGTAPGSYVLSTMLYASTTLTCTASDC